MEEMSDTWTDAGSMEVCHVKIRHIHIRHSGRLTDEGEQGGQLIGWCVTPPLAAAAALPSPRDRCAAPPQGQGPR